ncbi:glucosamine 6-phosphate synthetase [Candidatus Scalindua japonica]|uniref:Glucosamine 6-phosphate synthetase n=1 Tax=Candidatus Scalindua japonica TaxID=1284222 RepID=A0A286TTL7_9BACT|nr:SGNH/GDSL hydrolase family protein [Candidatus Scalindua japonica]GAX59204.1 glucosamine 6-phosphate synthetase [Candidatus Scalindua japonica]
MRKKFNFLRTLVMRSMIDITILSTSIFLPMVCFALTPNPVMTGMGDSIGEGVQSGDANFATQPSSYLNLLTRQIGFELHVPLIQSSPTGVVGDTSNRSRLMPFDQATNLSVSGADVNSMINDKADALSIGEIDSETDLVLFPQLGSQLEIAESLNSLLTVCWIGNNDALSAATSFDQLDGSQLTPVPEFQSDFQEIAQRLVTPGKAVVFANIPYVSDIAFLIDRQDLIKFLGSDFGLPEGDLTSIVVMFLIMLGIDDGSLLNNPDYVLDSGEIQLIEQRTDVFNQIIQETAAGLGMPVVNINALFNQIAANPPSPFGLTLTTRFLGGIFSLDGVHPSNFAHAVIANAFIQTINSSFNANIPLISNNDLLQILITDPFVDKDNDGRVTGRFGAGLLETLAPFLGISGDPNDFAPNNLPSNSDIVTADAFKNGFLSLKGKNPEQATEWDKDEFIKIFKDIFSPEIILK